MSGTRLMPDARRVVGWLTLALALWVAAAAIDRRTVVEIDSFNGRLLIDVAGTALEVCRDIRLVDRITVHAHDSIDPPGGLFLDITDRDGDSRRFGLPARFELPRGEIEPLGDWLLDEGAGGAVVVDEPVDLGDDFAVRVGLRGRFGARLTITLHGEPTTTFELRRGLLDNDLIARRENGAPLGYATIDPTPLADSLAVAAQLLRIVAVASVALALFASTALLRRSGEAPPRRSARRWRLAPAAALLLASAAGLVSAWVATDILQGLPHQTDEVVYLLQARWLLDGELAPAVSAIQRHLTVPFTYVRDGRWLAHYPVGWPVLLALGVAADAPHLVASLLSVAFVLLLFLVGRTIEDDLTGLAAAALCVLSPMARLLGGSMYAHLACATLVLLALWLLLAARRHRWGWAAGAGAGVALAGCLAVRPLTAVAVAIALGIWLAREAVAGERRLASTGILVSATAAGAIASIPALLYNAAITGDPLSFPYSMARGSMYALANLPYGIRNADAILALTPAALFGWGWPAVHGGLFLALPLAFAAVPFLARRTRAEDVLLLAVLVVVALGHLPARANGLHGFGARYPFDVFACLYLLTARGFRELARYPSVGRITSRTAVAAFLVLGLWSAATLPARLSRYRGYYGVTGALERQLATTGPERAVILVRRDSWWSWAEGARLITGPDRHRWVIAADLGANHALCAAYPDWPVLRWDEYSLSVEEAACDR